MTLRAFGSALFALTLGACATRSPLPAARQADNQFESEIQAFEAADRAHAPPAGGVVFVGSSSIRLWQTLEADFPDARVINRGFGGSELADAVRYAPRIVLPYSPALVVLYAGDNDLAAGQSPELVLRDYQAFVRLVRSKLPETRIAFISIKPSPSRWALAAKVRKANRLVKEYSSGDRRLHYVDVYTPMLDAAGAPRRELYLADGLHLNAAGYAIWRDHIAAIIARFRREP
ncbi:MAG: SGNH/GDSL hydrolase family protein [Gemmatimonadales bacterium]